MLGAASAVPFAERTHSLSVAGFQLSVQSWVPELDRAPVPGLPVCFAERAVAALAADPDVLRHNGKVLVAAGLAMGYGLTDVDGTTPRPLTLADV